MWRLLDAAQSGKFRQQLSDLSLELTRVGETCGRLFMHWKDLQRISEFDRVRSESLESIAEHAEPFIVRLGKIEKNVKIVGQWILHTRKRQAGFEYFLDSLLQVKANSVQRGAVVQPDGGDRQVVARLFHQVSPEITAAFHTRLCLL